MFMTLSAKHKSLPQNAVNILPVNELNVIFLLQMLHISTYQHNN